MSQGTGRVELCRGWGSPLVGTDPMQGLGTSRRVVGSAPILPRSLGSAGGHSRTACGGWWVFSAGMPGCWHAALSPSASPGLILALRTPVGRCPPRGYSAGPCAAHQSCWWKKPCALPCTLQRGCRCPERWVLPPYWQPEGRWVPVCGAGEVTVAPCPGVWWGGVVWLGKGTGCHVPQC